MWLINIFTNQMSLFLCSWYFLFTCSALTNKKAKTFLGHDSITYRVCSEQFKH